ncbi:L,D-transpeptidase [Aestuariivirga sp. YIM B02566]|uniref:L,D-transpeptidase n=1 Tax=Taklimakanibacter albus TaxID=2800327 RepID=A0ACC5R964_9HYPH|nr:L,D-transpeptidase [Aestuariivirga sp. YIM B02566]MBK1869206.1 L,D-transpeptidase [Aestuariivirga sp. YIM B02566]
MSKLLKISRRGALAFGALMVGGLPVRGQLVDKDPYALNPGEYTWHPERAATGPLSIIVSLPEQLVFVYRNGVRVASSTCSTGKPGHTTPTGVFHILQKDKNHHSATYDEAPMPNMNRLTWSGIALHAGNLPGYPASHGCIRLPLAFSQLLFGITHVGTAVIIANAATQPEDVVHPGMVLSDYAETELGETADRLNKTPLPATTPEDPQVLPLAVVVSSADKQGYLYENGVLAVQGSVLIADPGKPLGSHVFQLVGAHDGSKGLVWQAIGFHPQSAGAAPDPSLDVIKRIRADNTLLEAMKARLHPGFALVLTDEPADSVTRTEKGFVIITDDPKTA